MGRKEKGGCLVANALDVGRGMVFLYYSEELIDGIIESSLHLRVGLWELGALIFRAFRIAFKSLL